MQVRHRKYFSELETVCVPLAQATKQLLPCCPSKKQVGAVFSGEFTKHIDEKPAICRHCGGPDSRLHRLRQCPYSETWRSAFPSLMRQWDDLPEYT